MSSGPTAVSTRAADQAAAATFDDTRSRDEDWCLAGGLGVGQSEGAGDPDPGQVVLGRGGSAGRLAITAGVSGSVAPAARTALTCSDTVLVVTPWRAATSASVPAARSARPW